jgi:hypothetical protein
MSFVAYHKDSTLILRVIRGRNWTEGWFKTESAAKAALTRLEKKGSINADDYRISETAEFHRSIEKTEVVYSIMDKDHSHPITQGVNTPGCCDPSTETYWSM